MHRPSPQPAKGALAMARIPNTELARRLDNTPVWVSRVLNGYVRPPERFRRLVAELLGRPESELFVWDDEHQAVVS